MLLRVSSEMHSRPARCPLVNCGCVSRLACRSLPVTHPRLRIGCLPDPSMRASNKRKGNNLAQSLDRTAPWNTLTARGRHAACSRACAADAGAQMSGDFLERFAASWTLFVNA